MCTPRVAKELSETMGSFVAVTVYDPNERIEEENRVKGMTIRGFISGKPVYYSFTGLHQQLAAIETQTVVGLQYITQPIESCFGKAVEAGTDTNSGYSGSQETDQLPPNRVFSSDWFMVGKSSLGGYGAFAAVDIPGFTHFLLERPFLRLSNFNQLEDKYRKFNKEERAVFDGLHGYHRYSGDPLYQKWNANHFYLNGSEGIFAIASNFNHACYTQRNVQYRWDGKRKVMTFTAIRDIPKGEEILISYANNRQHIYSNFGFVCHCGGCEDQEWEFMEEAKF